MSHNVYCEEQQNNLIKLPTYLIFNENDKTITPCQNITTAIRIASEEGSICSLFERAGSMGKYYNHLCDVSKDVI